MLKKSCFTSLALASALAAAALSLTGTTLSLRIPLATIGFAMAAEPSALFSQKLPDEDWFSTLKGDERAAAESWAGQRSHNNPGNCVGPPDFVKGCNEAKARLTGPDVLRKSEPDYKAGLNSYVAAAAPPPAGQQPQVQAQQGLHFLENPNWNSGLGAQTSADGLVLTGLIDAWVNDVKADGISGSLNRDTSIQDSSWLVGESDNFQRHVDYINDTVGQPPQIRTVFVVAMENHNWTAPKGTTPQQIQGNPAAPYINSLIVPGNASAQQVSYASNYQSTGSHPSEPNYLWAEAGTDFGVTDDNDPVGIRGNNQTTTNSLSQYFVQSKAPVKWRSYQEDIDIDTSNNTVLPQSSWTVPLSSFSGTFTSGTNAYNGSNIFAYGAKHNPQVFFQGTNGGNDPSTRNPQRLNYAPLQQLFTDLNNNTVAQYNWITPDLDNDMHDPLSSFTYNGRTYTGDQAAVAQGDNFLSIVVPKIMASNAYKNGGVIVIWFDESEGGDNSRYTIPELIISPLARGNAYTNNVLYTHSSDVLTWQKVFHVGPCLGRACSATDLSDLFQSGVIPAGL